MTKETKIIFTLLILILGAGAVYYVNSNKNLNSNSDNTENNSNANTSTSNTQSNTQNANSVNSNSANTNSTNTEVSSVKTLSSTIRYQVPEEHSETLNVSVTLANGIVTDVTFSEKPSNRESSEYWEGFQSNFKKQEVVGKKVGEIKLSRVGGASLTTMAFNNALQEIANK